MSTRRVGTCKRLKSSLVCFVDPLNTASCCACYHSIVYTTLSPAHFPFVHQARSQHAHPEDFLHEEPTLPCKCHCDACRPPPPYSMFSVCTQSSRPGDGRRSTASAPPGELLRLPLTGEAQPVSFTVSLHPFPPTRPRLPPPPTHSRLERKAFPHLARCPDTEKALAKCLLSFKIIVIDGHQRHRSAYCLRKP